MIPKRPDRAKIASPVAAPAFERPETTRSVRDANTERFVASERESTLARRMEARRAMQCASLSRAFAAPSRARDASARGTFARGTSAG